LRILLLIDDYYPSTKSGAKMMHDLGVQFVRDGHEAIVVTTAQGTRQDLSVTTEDRVTVVRVRTGKIKDASRAMRGLREFRLSANIWRKAKAFFTANPCDLVVFYSPTIFFGDLVRKLKTLWGCSSYLVLRDIFPQWAVDAGVIKKGLLYRYLRRKELAQYDAADVIGAESPGSLRYFADELSDKAYRVEVLLSWTELQERPRPGTSHRLRLGLGEKVVFFYGGNIGVAQDMDNILRLAANLNGREDMFFLLVGSGSEAPRLEREIEQQHLTNLRILPPLPQERYLQCLSEFDVGLISLDRRLSTSNLPGKLFGYMTCGVPILASINPGNDLAQLLPEADAGIACENGDDQGLCEAAQRLAADGELRKRMGNNARILLEGRFSVYAAAAQILSHFQYRP
jgi:glycosyltransferase involved in cell wall biosynthesis